MPGTCNAWRMDDYTRAPRTEKAIFASKAERTERAILVQDNDPQVLFFLLKNPRLTIDEVIRLAKSPHLTYQIAELMMNRGLFKRLAA